MKKLIVLSLIFVLSACAAVGWKFAPDTAEEATKDITYDYDKFDKSGWLTTFKYASEANSMSGGIVYNYRANYDQYNNLNFIQIYMRLSNDDWWFVDSAVDEFGNQLEFIEIDRDTFSGAGAVGIHEFFAVTIPRDLLEKYSAQHVDIKVSGKRGEQIVKIEKPISEAFLAAIDSPQKFTN